MAKQRELKAYLAFCIRARDQMGRCIREHPPDSEARYRLKERFLPTVVDDVTKTPLNRAISQARQNGELLVLGPLLTDLDAGFREYADVFIEHPQGNFMPVEPSRLTNALNALLPYLGTEPPDTRIVEALIAEAQRIVGEHCNPDNEAGFLDENGRYAAYRGLNERRQPVFDCLRPRIGEPAAQDLCLRLLQRVQRMLELASREMFFNLKTPDDQKAMRLNHLRREYNTTDLPVIYRELRTTVETALGTNTAIDSSIQGYHPADWFSHEHGIKQSRLSEAARGGKVSTKAAPKGMLDSQGRSVRMLYNVAEGLKHCSPKRVTKKTRRKLGSDSS